MKIVNKKTIVSLILLLTIAISLIAFPTANAQPTSFKATYAFIGALPNPAGVGQAVLLHYGISDATQEVDDGWEGITITITKPDNDTETLGPLRTDSTGGSGVVYVPTQVGTYYLQTNFPEQWYNYSGFGFSGPVSFNRLYKASTSEKLALNVTEEPQPYYPSMPLPTEYWTRPIDAQLREWTTISGNWLAIPVNRVAPNNNGPETAHILWSRQLTEGGLVGGEDAYAYVTGDAYQGRFANPVIVNGILFYNKFHGSLMGAGGGPSAIVAVDLHTGKELWSRSNATLSFGQTLYWNTMNSHGYYAYVYSVTGTTWQALDPLTGELMYTMTNVPSGTRVYGPNGEILIYTVNTAGGWMTMWNSTKAAIAPSALAFLEGNWAPEGQIINAQTRGYQWNKTIPTGLTGSVAQYFAEDRLFGTDVTGATGGSSLTTVNFWALNLKPGQEGTLLFKSTWTPPSGNITFQYATASIEDGVFVVTAKETRQLYGFSTNTGQLLWGPTEAQPYFDQYTLGESRALTRAVAITEGKVFSVGVAGILHCFDASTGNTLWKYAADQKYQELLWANNWWLNIAFITDGKIYLVHDEHSPINPYPRGAPYICVDIETGAEVWKIEGAFRGTQWGGTGIIGDSIIATMDTYNMRVYAVGKGPTAITVNAPDMGISFGSSIMIKGTVTDVSPGTKSDELALRFPNGVPAVSDASMSDWMLYVYKQFPRPTDATGVPVTLSVLDSNGNYREIGTATSNSDGFFTFNWVPDISGEYTVYANFAGSKSYWPSHAVTSFAVDPAATSAPPQEPIASMADMYILPGIIAIIVAIIVGFAVTILVLRKLP